MPPRPTGSLGSSRALARRIAYEREQRGWKQVTLARRMTNAGFDMTQSTISKIENDDSPRRITVDELAGFSQVFGIRADELLLPPELVVDKTARKLLENWRAAHVRSDEALGRLVAHLESHPARAEDAIRDLLSAEDWKAVIAGVETSAAKVSRDFRAKHGRGLTLVDLRAAHEEMEER